MAMPIIFNAINVNGQYTNATVSLGINAQNGWSGQSKNNFGVGPLLGMNLVITPLSYVFDPDALESPMPAPSVNPNFENQQL